MNEEGRLERQLPTGVPRLDRVWVEMPEYSFNSRRRAWHRQDQAGPPDSVSPGRPNGRLFISPCSASADHDAALSAQMSFFDPGSQFADPLRKLDEEPSKRDLSHVLGSIVKQSIDSCRSRRRRFLSAPRPNGGRTEVGRGPPAFVRLRCA